VLESYFQRLRVLYIPLLLTRNSHWNSAAVCYLFDVLANSIKRSLSVTAKPATTIVVTTTVTTTVTTSASGDGRNG
jgi:hypothetical protein